MFDFVDSSSLANLLGLVVPLIVAVITKKFASSGLKGTMNAAVCTILGSIVYYFNADGVYDWKGFVYQSVNIFIVSVATYYGVLKPTGVAGTFTNLAPNIGIGSPPSLETESKGAEEAGDTGLQDLSPAEVSRLTLSVTQAPEKLITITSPTTGYFTTDNSVGFDTPYMADHETPVQTDNTPRDDDGDQSVISQDPQIKYTS